MSCEFIAESDVVDTLLSKKFSNGISNVCPYS